MNDHTSYNIGSSISSLLLAIPCPHNKLGWLPSVTRDLAKEPVWVDFFFKCPGRTFSHLIHHANSSLELSLTLSILGWTWSCPSAETDRPWLSAQFKQLIAHRHKALACQNQSLFTILRNKVNWEREHCWKVYYENKVKSLRSSRPRYWWREVKQLCATSKSTERDLKSMLHKDLICEGAVLAEKNNQAFVSVMKDYLPLTDNTRVSAEDDDPIVVTELSVARKLHKVSTFACVWPRRHSKLGPKGICRYLGSTHCWHPERLFLWSQCTSCMEIGRRSTVT